MNFPSFSNSGKIFSNSRLIPIFPIEWEPWWQHLHPPTLVACFSMTLNTSIFHYVHPKWRNMTATKVWLMALSNNEYVACRVCVGQLSYIHLFIPSALDAVLWYMKMTFFAQKGTKYICLLSSTSSLKERITNLASHGFRMTFLKLHIFNKSQSLE